MMQLNQFHTTQIRATMTTANPGLSQNAYAALCVLDLGEAAAEYQIHSGLMRVQTIYIVGDPAYPHTVYIYTGTGLVGLYTDPERAVDLVHIALAEGLEGLVNIGGVRDRYFHRDIANVFWGRCVGNVLDNVSAPPAAPVQVQ